MPTFSDNFGKHDETSTLPWDERVKLALEVVQLAQRGECERRVVTGAYDVLARALGVPTYDDRIPVELDADTMRFLKHFAAEAGMTIEDFATRMIGERLAELPTR